MKHCKALISRCWLTVSLSVRVMLPCTRTVAPTSASASACRMPHSDSSALHSNLDNLWLIASLLVRLAPPCMRTMSLRIAAQLRALHSRQTMCESQLTASLKAIISHVSPKSSALALLHAASPPRFMQHSWRKAMLPCTQSVLNPSEYASSSAAYMQTYTAPCYLTMTCMERRYSRLA